VVVQNRALPKLVGVDLICAVLAFLLTVASRIAVR
jgi:hypothetical protein